MPKFLFQKGNTFGFQPGNKFGRFKPVHGHGTTRKGVSPTYASWRAMLTRCKNSNHVYFRNYGGRGITVCARWDVAQGGSFQNFLTDMGERPAGLTLDRISSYGHYEPGNCRWATPKQQRANHRELAPC